MAKQLLSEAPEKAKTSGAYRVSSPDSAQSFQGAVHPISQLQRTLGNRDVARLIQTRRLSPSGELIGLQRKLTVGAADDQYEQEADRVARQVMSMPDAASTNSMQRTTSPVEDKDKMLQTKPLAASVTPLVQREMMKNEEPDDKEKPIQAKFLTETSRKPLQRQPEAEEEKKEPIQAKSAGELSGSFEAGDNIENQISLSKGGGNPLPDTVRAFMEPRFGVDFSQVRVHTGREAIQMSEAVGAQAFTHGQDIYFGAGHSPTELALTAHELTHVVQQKGKDTALTTARASPVREHTPGSLVQGAWKMTGVTHEEPVIGSSGRGNQAVYPLPRFMGVSGIVKAWQEVVEFAGKHEGGNAQLMMRRVSRYRFEHDGDDNNLLTFHVGANIFGGAEADDLHYAEARAALVGNMAVRTQENPAPEHTSLFPPIDAGGKSEATKSNIGEVDAEIPIGDKTVNVHIPLTITNEGALASINESSTVDPSIAGDGKWKMVDVYLVAYMDAAADIETEFWGFFGLTDDVNWAHIIATYTLSPEEQKIPAKPPPPTAETEPEHGSGQISSTAKSNRIRVQLQHKGDDVVPSVPVEKDTGITVAEGQKAVDTLMSRTSKSVSKKCKKAGDKMKKTISDYPPQGVDAKGNVARKWCEDHPDYERGIRLDLENLAGKNFTS